ncbi:Zn-dependent protease with chaperone function [Kitasatospora sp. MAA4]|uniref:M48 family metalloprotease n=1 Tax=Kitasatospora sp. MAA4 TaxID=3035093 RepID=UPI002474AC4E|nr:M48 family metalloprotease [Kitasatospora sp. MAA4]MDH6135552.1 Zn-dependent protease with chaperone function [Kitasatospora sp. MAA4]
MARPTDGPFSTPAGTTLRFSSLIVLAATVTATWWGTFVSVWRPTTGLPEDRCSVRTGYYLPMGDWLSPQDTLKHQHFEHCIAGLALTDVLWIAGALGLTGLLALLLFAVHPWWHRRRARLVPIDELSSPETASLQEELQELVELAGLVRAPRFLLDPANARPAGQAFGGLGRRQVSLSAGLLVQRRRAPAKFRAVLAHELAHIRNGDVTITYLTLAVWRAFVLVTVLPVLATLVDPVLQTTQPLRNPLRVGMGLLLTNLVDLGWFFVVLIALVYVIRISVLRAREGYADARATQWSDPAALREVFLASAEQDGTRWWHTHPRLLDRVRLLDQPERLLRPGFWETFTAAFVAQIAGDYATQAVEGANLSSTSFAYQASHDAATLLTALVVVVSAWRGAAFVRSGAGGRAVYTRAGLGLGLGLATAYGLLVLRADRLLRHQPAANAWEFDTAGLRRDLLLAALMLVAVLVLCHWAGHCWQLLATASRRRRLFAAAAMLLAIWACLRWWNTLNYFIPPLGPTLSADASVWRHFVSQAHGSGLDRAVVEAVLAPFILLWVIGPATLFAAPLLWLVPLLLGAARREAVRSAARIGGLAALVWLVIDIGLRAGAHLTASAAIRAGDGYAVVFLCWEIIAVLAVQAGTGLLLGMRRTRMMPALFATTLTGLLCCLILWGTHRPGDVFVAFYALRDIGVLGSALTVLGVLLGRRLSRRARARPAAVGLPGVVTRLGPAAVAAVFLALAVWPALHLWTAPRHTRVDSVGAPDYVPPPPADPQEIGKESYMLWLQGGGQGQMEAAFTALFRYVGQLNPALDKQQPDWDAIARDQHLKEDCRNLVTAVGRARAFPAPPWAKAAADWSAYLGQLADDGDACTAVSVAPDLRTIQAELKAAQAQPQLDALDSDQKAALSTAT